MAVGRRQHWSSATDTRQLVAVARRWRDPLSARRSREEALHRACAVARPADATLCNGSRLSSFPTNSRLQQSDNWYGRSSERLRCLQEIRVSGLHSSKSGSHQVGEGFRPHLASTSVSEIPRDLRRSCPDVSMVRTLPARRPATSLPAADF